MLNDFSPEEVSGTIELMTRPSWIRADDGDWYRTSEVVAVKTLPHHDGGFLVSVETHRHDNVDVTGTIGDEDGAGRGRDALARLLTRAEEGRMIVYAGGEFTDWAD